MGQHDVRAAQAEVKKGEARLAFLLRAVSRLGMSGEAVTVQDRDEAETAVEVQRWEVERLKALLAKAEAEASGGSELGHPARKAAKKKGPRVRRTEPEVREGFKRRPAP